MRIKILLLNILIPLSLMFCNQPAETEYFIRINQLGFLVDDIKTGIIFSESPFEIQSVNIRSVFDNTTIYSSIIVQKDSVQSKTKFKNIASFDFSELKIEGEYYAEYSGLKSMPFKINDYIYNDVVDSLLIFYKVQRCGPTNPYLHDNCHLSDVARIEGRADSTMIDLTGGWHDAGDYIKFLSTTSYTTYLMMFAYEFDKIKFGFDNDKNGVADILDEAKIGLDWLLRCNYNGDTLILQVQDTSDHSVGWRLPEDDTLRFKRIGYKGAGKNIIGLYVAALSLANRIWQKDIGDESFAERCLQTARKFYSIKDSVPDIDSSFSTHYKDTEFYGKLALGAIELFESTKEEIYLNDAKTFSDSAGADYWWSWGNMNSLAHFKIAKYDSSKIKFLRESVDFYFTNMTSSSFDEPIDYSWGTTNSFLGTALTEILYRSLTNDKSYELLSSTQRDFVLARNKWGISFIYGIGSSYPKQIHSQTAYYNDGYLPGALVGGPSPETILNKFDNNSTNDLFNTFNAGEEIQYFDQRINFITNEASLNSNATALFVIGYYSRR